MATLSQLLERGAASGVFRRGIDPVQLYVSIAALGYFYLSNNHTLSTIFGRDLMAPTAKAERGSRTSRRSCSMRSQPDTRERLALRRPATLS